jgi:hypothetical protein
VGKISWQTFLGANVVYTDGGIVSTNSELVTRMAPLWDPEDWETIYLVPDKFRFQSQRENVFLKRTSFRIDLILWFMVGLTNAWKHVVKCDQNQVDLRIEAVERFLHTPVNPLTVRAGIDSDRRLSVFSIQNHWDGKGISQPSIEHKTGLALSLVSADLRFGLPLSSPLPDRFQGVLEENRWYTELCLPEIVLEMPVDF